jgi:hypothetical protein
MPLIEGLQLPFGIQPVTPNPVNSWEGPYISVSEALISIPIEVRYPTMEVRILDSINGNKKYWFKDGIEDVDLVLFGIDESFLTGETADRISGDTMLFNMITGETADRIQQDIVLHNEITGLTETVTENYSDLHDLITGETYNRITGDTYLQNQITGLTETVNDKFDKTGGTVNGYITASGFTGDGSGLTNIPASGVTGLNLDRITSGDNSAVMSGDGLIVNTGVTATSFITSGGTSSQFVKGDGYLDNNNYLTTTGASETYTTINDFTGHTNNISNPHNTTANQVGAYTTGQTDNLLLGKSDTGHTHDDIYYTETEINNLLLGKSNTGHTHSISDVINLQTELNNKSNTGHTHNYLPTSGGTLSGGLNVNGDLNIYGDIIQSGSTWETHANQVYSSGDTITLRDGAINGLTNGEYAGIIAKKYDNVNDGVLVFDNNGVARVGDMDTVNWTGTTQPIATREENPISDGLSVWDSINLRFKTIPKSTTGLTNDSGFITSADIPTQIITENIPVSLSNGKTLGKYVNGQTIMSSGMTVTQLFKDIAIEALAPTVTLTSPTTIAFNQTSIANVLNFSYVINSLSATVQTVSLDWRRGGTGSWVNLSTNTGLTTYTHNYTDTSGNTSTFNYRYVVTDSAGGTATGTTNITPAAYVAPSINSMSAGTTSRDLGNISSTITATIVRNSANVLLTSYKIQRSVNGGAYSDISGTTTTISGSTWNVSYVDNNASLLNSTSITYRIVVTDIYSTTTGSVATITFTHRSFLGYSSNTVLNLSEILGLANSTLTNSKSRTIAGVTAGVGNYTYYVYASSAGDLSNCLLDGVEAILGAFTKLTDVTGTNTYGANVSYRVYKSNSTNAFSNNSLIFS